MYWPITNVISCSNVLEEQPNNSQLNYKPRARFGIVSICLLHSVQMSKRGWDKRDVALFMTMIRLEIVCFIGTCSRDGCRVYDLGTRYCSVYRRWVTRYLRWLTLRPAERSFGCTTARRETEYTKYFDLTLTQTCGNTPTVSNCGYFWTQSFFKGSSPHFIHTVLVMLMNLQISWTAVDLRTLARLYFFNQSLVKHIHTGEPT